MQLVWPGPGPERDAAKEQLLLHLKELPVAWQIVYKPADHTGKDANYRWSWPAADDLFADHEAKQEQAAEVRPKGDASAAGAIVVLGARVLLSEAEDEASRKAKRRRYSKTYAEDVRLILDNVGVRQTQSELLDSLSRSGMMPDASTLGHTLAEMVRRKQLTNARDQHGVGYGLPSWLSDEEEDCGEGMEDPQGKAIIQHKPQEEPS